MKRSPKTAENVANPWQRLLLAVFAVVLMATAFLVQQSGWFSGTSQELLCGTLYKVGMVLGLAWLAAPQLARFGWQKLQGTALVAVIVVIVLFAARPKVGAIAGAVLVGSSVAFGAIKWFRDLSR